MLSIQVSINGVPITVVNAYRDMSLSMLVSDKYMYRYSAATMPSDLNGPPSTYTGAVSHVYDDGLEKLTQIIMGDIAKKRRRNASPAQAT